MVLDRMINIVPKVLRVPLITPNSRSKKGPVAHRPRLIITSIIIFTPYLFDLYFSGPPVPLIHLVIIFIIIIISIPVLIISVYLLLLFRN